MGAAAALLAATVAIQALVSFAAAALPGGADELGAELIVAVGTHATLVEFLDKGRSGMASTFLTRLRVGSKLVDAKGVSRLYRQRISNVQLLLLVLAGLLALGVALAATEAGQTLIALVAARFDDFFSWVGRLFGGGA